LVNTLIKEAKSQIALQRPEKSRIFNVFCKAKLRYYKFKKNLTMIAGLYRAFCNCSAIPLIFDFNKFRKKAGGRTAPLTSKVAFFIFIQQI